MSTHHREVIQFALFFFRGHALELKQVALLQLLKHLGLPARAEISTKCLFDRSLGANHDLILANNTPFLPVDEILLQANRVCAHRGLTERFTPGEAVFQLVYERLSLGLSRRQRSLRDPDIAQGFVFAKPSHGED